MFMRLLIVLYVTTLLSASVWADEVLPTITVEDKSFQQYETFDAVIEPLHSATISSRISAQVIELNYDVNDTVPKGAVIMKFRDAEFQARVAQSQAALLADKAQLQEATARQKEASSEAVRVKKLFKRKLLAQSALDAANANLSAANARIQAVKAQKKAHQAQLDEAKVQLSYTQIIAPYDGVVSERMIELGEMASPGQHLMSGISLDHLRAIVNVPQYLLPVIKSAQSPTLLLDGRELAGENITVIPYADLQSHSFKVRVDLPAKTANVYPGMYGKLQFVVGSEQVRVVPISTIVQRSEVAGVYVINDHINLRQIRLGRVFGDEQEVLSGLAEGEQIAVDPLEAARFLKLNSSGSHL